MEILVQKGYSYVKHLSNGGQGEVHLVMRNHKLYIAKIFSMADDNTLQVLKHIQDINIPNIPKIYDVYKQNNSIILIRDYIEGHTLLEEIERNNTIELKRACYIILKICESLDALHNTKPNPIIYRDLKPENIMISKDDDVFLIDFGIARFHKNESTRDTVLIGTKGYTAPEVMAGMQSDNRSDIYSVGLIFYEMLTGKNLLMPPFQIRPVKESVDSLPKCLDNVIAKATNMSMVMRYRNISEFSNIVKKASKQSNRHIKKFGYFALLLVILVGLFFGYRYFDLSKIQKSKSNTYVITEHLEFDHQDEISMFQLVGPKIDSGEIREADFPNLIHDGIYMLQCETIISQKLVQGSFVHLRILPEDMNEQGAILFLSVFSDPDIMASYNIPFLNREIINSEIIDESGYFIKESLGTPIFTEHKWIDIIISLDDNGENLRYFIFDIGDDTQFSYGGMHLFDEWIGKEYSLALNIPFEYWEDEIGVPLPVSQVEFIIFGSGSIEKYLEENTPAYHNNIDKVDDFLNKDIYYIPLEEFTMHEF